MKKNNLNIDSSLISKMGLSTDWIHNHNEDAFEDSDDFMDDLDSEIKSLIGDDNEKDT